MTPERMLEIQTLVQRLWELIRPKHKDECEHKRTITEFVAGTSRGIRIWCKDCMQDVVK